MLTVTKVSIIGAILLASIIGGIAAGAGWQYASACIPDNVSQACDEFNKKIIADLDQKTAAAAGSGNKLNIVMLDFANEDAKLVNWVVGGDNAAAKQIFIDTTRDVEISGNDSKISSYPTPPESWWFEHILNGFSEKGQIIYAPLLDPATSEVILVQWTTGDTNPDALKIYNDIMQKSKEISQAGS